MSSAPTAAGSAQQEVIWGRVLIAGATDWINVGKKDKSGQSLVNQDVHPDLYEPHVMRPLCNIPIVSVHGAGCATHFVAIDTSGGAWLWGRNSTSCLGLDGEQFQALFCGMPRRVKASNFGAAQGTKIVHAAVGRHHTLLVGSTGQVWTAGSNNFGQCGQPKATPEVKTFTPLPDFPTIAGQPDPVIQAAAGISFSLILTASGKVYAFGSGEHGQLGNGRTGEDIAAGRKIVFEIVDEPELVRGLEGKHIVQIAAGNQHGLALDNDGFVYAWGNGGYCRTGFGDQKNALIAKLVQGRFMAEHSQTRASKIFAGPTCSVVIDRQSMLHIAGKFKMTGDGSSGQPYTTFKPIEEIIGCKVETAASGGQTNFAVAPDEDPEPGVEKGAYMTVAWGQQATFGELALGNEAPLSATRPQRVEPLSGVRVFAIAAGQNATVFLARPGDATSSLPRHPIAEAATECIVCNEDRGEQDSPLECEKCETPYHLGCLQPPLVVVPEEEWFCERCTREMQLDFEPVDSANGRDGDSFKRKADDTADDMDSSPKKQKLQ